MVLSPQVSPRRGDMLDRFTCGAAPSWSMTCATPIRGVLP